MCFSLCKRPITLDILSPIIDKWHLKQRLLSSVRPRKLNSCIYSMGDPFKSKCNRGVTHISQRTYKFNHACLIYKHTHSAHLYRH